VSVTVSEETIQAAMQRLQAVRERRVQVEWIRRTVRENAGEDAQAKPDEKWPRRYYEDVGFLLGEMDRLSNWLAGYENAVADEKPGAG